MARTASVRVKNGHWFSEAGGVGRYFGRRDTVSRVDAMASLWRALANSQNERIDRCWGLGIHADDQELINSFLPDCKSKRKSLSKRLDPQPQHLSMLSPTVDAIACLFLAWVERHRAEKAHRERTRHLKRFCDAYGTRKATDIASAHLEAFADELKAQEFAPLYVHKHIDSLRMMMRWAVKHSHLPNAFAPFAHAEPIHVPAKPLLESDLPTDEEVRLLIANARDDLRDMLIVYHGTGARTHELIEACVGDFQPNACTIVLGKHKRSKSMREPIPRMITLSCDALEIVKCRCVGRPPEDAIFVRDTGRGRWTGEAITQRFQRVRKSSKIRDMITIYSLRHLWISESLMLGLDALLVARMAGTSVAMLEKVYGHFKVKTFADAQSKMDASRALRKET